MNFRKTSEQISINWKKIKEVAEASELPDVRPMLKWMEFKSFQSSRSDKVSKYFNKYSDILKTLNLIEVDGLLVEHIEPKITVIEAEPKVTVIEAEPEVSVIEAKPVSKNIRKNKLAAMILIKTGDDEPEVDDFDYIDVDGFLPEDDIAEVQPDAYKKITAKVSTDFEGVPSIHTLTKQEKISRSTIKFIKDTIEGKTPIKLDEKSLEQFKDIYTLSTAYNHGCNLAKFYYQRMYGRDLPKDYIRLIKQTKRREKLEAVEEKVEEVIENLNSDEDVDYDEIHDEIFENLFGDDLDNDSDAEESDTDDECFGALDQSLSKEASDMRQKRMYNDFMNFRRYDLYKLFAKKYYGNDNYYKLRQIERRIKVDLGITDKDDEFYENKRHPTIAEFLEWDVSQISNKDFLTEIAPFTKDYMIEDIQPRRLKYLIDNLFEVDKRFGVDSMKSARKVNKETGLTNLETLLVSFLKMKRSLDMGIPITASYSKAVLGRRFVKGMRLQKIMSNYKAFLTHKKYIDFDGENLGNEIFNYIVQKRLGYELVNFPKYNRFYQKYRSDLAKYIPDKTQAKRMITIAINNGRIGRLISLIRDRELLKFFIMVYIEIAISITKIKDSKLFDAAKEEYYTLCHLGKMEEKNVTNAKVYCNMIYNVENSILETTIDAIFSSKKLNQTDRRLKVLEFDGVLIHNSILEKLGLTVEQLTKKINKKIFERYDYEFIMREKRTYNPFREFEGYNFSDERGELDFYKADETVKMLRDIATFNREFSVEAANHGERFNFTPDKTVEERYIDLQDAFEKYDTITVKSPCSTGKSYQIYQYLKKNPTKTCLFVSFRRSLAAEYKRSFGDLDFHVYSDSSGLLKSENYPYLICQVNSLHRVVGKYDILVLDETMYTSQMLTNFVTNVGAVIQSLQSYVTHCEKVIMTDACLDNRVCEIYTKLRKNKSSIKIRNTIARDRTVKFQMKENLYLDIKEKISNKKRIVVCSNSLKYLKSEIMTMAKNFNAKSILISSDNIDEVDLETIKWDDYDVIAYSPSISAGVNILVDVHKVYGIFTHKSCNAMLCYQMLERARNLEDTEISCTVLGYDKNFAIEEMPTDELKFFEQLKTVKETPEEFIKYHNKKKTVQINVDFFNQIIERDPYHGAFAVRGLGCLFLHNMAISAHSYNNFIQEMIFVLNDNGIKTTIEDVKLQSKIFNEVQKEISANRTEAKRVNDIAVIQKHLESRIDVQQFEDETISYVLDQTGSYKTKTDHLVRTFEHLFCAEDKVTEMTDDLESLSDTVSKLDETKKFFKVQLSLAREVLRCNRPIMFENVSENLCDILAERIMISSTLRHTKTPEEGKDIPTRFGEKIFDHSDVLDYNEKKYTAKIIYDKMSHTSVKYYMGLYMGFFVLEKVLGSNINSLGEKIVADSISFDEFDNLVSSIGKDRLSQFLGISPSSFNHEKDNKIKFLNKFLDYIGMKVESSSIRKMARGVRSRVYTYTLISKSYVQKAFINELINKARDERFCNVCHCDLDTCLLNETCTRQTEEYLTRRTDPIIL